MTWRAPTRSWIVLLVAALIAGHVIVPYALANTALSATMMSGVVILMVIKHLGLLTALLGPLSARLRRPPRS